ncbi:hypothetical protein [Prevotella sp. E2-28]|uniref:hypothetical protein n=1 Tax=Prevotella sp. E2-28 TaxID=2913620 RepID=UPI001EDB79A6|nr:hypothetical protein [Prevotella sp. E2-28]UKK53783.1 hypothetical protein L6465_00485 [Prevotella sp. E2-28]
MMNLKKLFVVGAVLVMASTTANAELVNGVRQRPNVAKAEAFQADVSFYLFNTKARLFFVGANDWNTRASVADHGYKVKFTNFDTTVPGAYEFTDSVETKTNWLSVFSTNDGGAIWVDNATETYRFWEVVVQPNGQYRISNNKLDTDLTDAQSEHSIAGKFLGWNGSEADTRLYFVDPTAEGAGVDWQFVTEDTYKAWTEAWAAMKDQFNAAAELLTYINSAKEKGIDVTAEVAIYEEETSSVEALNAATVSVQKKINDALAGDASVTKPSDMTGALINPNFDNASADGWKGTAPNMVGDGNHGKADVAEHYDKTFDTYQELTNMPAGVYMLSNNGFLRGWWDDAVNHTNYTAFLYAIADGDTMQVAMANPWDIKNTEALGGATEFGTTASESTEDRDGGPYYAPNDPSAARVYFEKGYYENKVFFAIAEGNVKLGVKKDVNRGSEWATFDNFKLAYLGNAAEAYEYWVKQTPKTDYTGVVVSEQYLNAYEAAFNVTATNKAEAVAAMKAIQAASDSIAENSKLWATLQKKYDEGMSMVVEHQTLISAGNLSDYLEYGYIGDEEGTAPKDILEAEEKTGDANLSNEVLQTMINQIVTFIEAVEKEIKDGLQPGTDVTKFLTNPDFEDGANGWTVVSKGGGNVQLGGNNDNHCYEAWHSTNFEVYQEVKNLPVGVYEISVNGYMRYLDGQDAINKWDEAPTDVPIYVYMNDSKSNFVNWLSYPKSAAFYEAIEGATFLTDSENKLPVEWQGGSFPDNMTAASAAFAEGGYLNTAKCLVTEADSITRIGVKGTPEAKYWPIFDNFKLTFLGMDIAVVKPLLEEKVEEAQALVNEISTKSAKEAFATAYADATAALSGEDGNAMFDMIAKLDKAMNDLKEGRALCVEFMNTVQAFMSYAEQSSSPLAQDALMLGGTIQSKLENSELDKEDIEAYKLKLREFELKMELPADYAQGSENGVDITAFIQTPSFEKVVNGAPTNSIDGWQGTAGYNFGNDDTQKGALALEFYNKTFDMYQDIAGVGEVVLPKGNYCLQVNAFNRPTDNNPAYLYVLADKDTLAVTDVMKHADGFDGREESGPNSMTTAVDYFNEGRYLNSIAFRFQGDTLRIGIKHPETASTDWIIMDNFKLLFFGENATGVETVINMGKPVQVQYFTLDGRRANATQKGLLIRKTIMDNGAVIVRKIQK